LEDLIREAAFSILERIDVGETNCAMRQVSQSGAFSILERIDVGETRLCHTQSVSLCPFSILERIDVGETHCSTARILATYTAFSILERIDVGETQTGEVHGPRGEVLSVSSNGSTWVKPFTR